MTGAMARVVEWLSRRDAGKVVRRLLLEGLGPRPDMTVLKDLSFGTHERQRFDFYTPKLETPRGMIVFVHGGGWTSGSRSIYRFLAQNIVAAGYAVVIPDYRLAPEFCFPAFIDDLDRVLDYLDHKAGELGTRGLEIALVGHSAGAYNCMMIATGPRGGRVTCAVGLAGPYGFHPFDYKEVRLAFARTADAPDASRVLTCVRPGLPPICLIHGDADRKVLSVNTVLFSRALRAQGNEVEEHHVPGQGHVGILLGLVRPFNLLSPVQGHVMGFLERYCARSAALDHASAQHALDALQCTERCHTANSERHRRGSEGRDQT